MKANSPLDEQSAKDLQVFKFNNRTIRITVDGFGITWFLAKDVCEVLTIANVSAAVDRLDADEKGIVKVTTFGGPQQMSIISESGLYSLTMRSNKPEAKAFKKWVTSVVLSSIRKTGSYGITTAEIDLLVAHKVSGFEAQVMQLSADIRQLLSTQSAQPLIPDAPKRTGIRGVYFNKTSRTWFAHLGFGETLYSRSFATESDAIDAVAKSMAAYYRNALAQLKNRDKGSPSETHSSGFNLSAEAALICSANGNTCGTEEFAPILSYLKGTLDGKAEREIINAVRSRLPFRAFTGGVRGSRATLIRNTLNKMVLQGLLVKNTHVNGCIYALPPLNLFEKWGVWVA